MAKILYGVAGEGMGHAVRSKVVIEHLRKKHKVKVVAAAKAYSFLSKYFEVEKIDYFKIIYRNNKVANLLTFLNNFFRFPAIIAKSWKIPKIIMEFKPDVIITDFEPIVDYFAFLKKIPVISIDNQHLITNINVLKVGKSRFIDSWITKIIVRSFIIKSNKFFINSYYDIKIKNKNVALIKPLLRKEIIKLKSTEKDHILVYQTSGSNKHLIVKLKQFGNDFIIYGFDINKKVNNLTFKKINDKEFLEDLRTCKAVITNGGFTLISEALYLRKPILSIPVKKHFEQILNSLILEKLNYGQYSKEINKDELEKFLGKIKYYKKKLKNYKKYNSEDALRKIEEEIKLLS